LTVLARHLVGGELAQCTAGLCLVVLVLPVVRQGPGFSGVCRSVAARVRRGSSHWVIRSSRSARVSRIDERLAISLKQHQSCIVVAVSPDRLSRGRFGGRHSVLAMTLLRRMVGSWGVKDGARSKCLHRLDLSTPRQYPEHRLHAVFTELAPPTCSGRTAVVAYWPPRHETAS
jgi:hypothetical protein